MCGVYVCASDCISPLSSRTSGGRRRGTGSAARSSVGAAGPVQLRGGCAATRADNRARSSTLAISQNHIAAPRSESSFFAQSFRRRPRPLPLPSRPFPQRRPCPRGHARGTSLRGTSGALGAGTAAGAEGAVEAGLHRGVAVEVGAVVVGGCRCRAAARGSPPLPSPWLGRCAHMIASPGAPTVSLLHLTALSFPCCVVAHPKNPFPRSSSA